MAGYREERRRENEGRGMRGGKGYGRLEGNRWGKGQVKMSEGNGKTGLLTSFEN
jgi:hypothetical protein